MDGEQKSWAVFMVCVTVLLLAVIAGTAGYNAYETALFVQGNYCQRSFQSSWIKCDMLKDVVMK